MAEITQLKSLIDSYGVGVRAGVITPQTEDEVYFREVMGIPDMSSEVVADWAETFGRRHPITMVWQGVEQSQQNPKPEPQSGDEPNEA